MLAGTRSRDQPESQPRLSCTCARLSLMGRKNFISRLRGSTDRESVTWGLGAERILGGSGIKSILGHDERPTWVFYIRLGAEKECATLTTK